MSTASDRLVSEDEGFKLPKPWHESWQALRSLPTIPCKSGVNHQVGHHTGYHTRFSIGRPDVLFPSSLIGFPELLDRVVELAAAGHDQIDKRDATDAPERISPVDETNSRSGDCNVAGPEVPMHNGGRQLRKLLRQVAKESTRLLESQDPRDAQRAEESRKMACQAV